MAKIKTRNNFTIRQSGISLIEVLVCVAIFAILSVSVYGLFTSIIKGIVYYREKTTVSFLAEQYLEIVRNMPYSKVGTIQGNPHGPLADLPDPINTTTNGNNYQIYYTVSYVDDPADGTILANTDSAPNDYKQVKLYIKNENTGIINSFLTNVSPRGLEGMASGGALYLNIFDAVGQPVSGALIRITNNSVLPKIDLTRLSDANGNWMEVGLPDSANSYHIVVSKNGYSTDQTYPILAQNPNPIKSDATISSGQVTNVSFSIDHLSNLAFNTLNQKCLPVSGVGMQVHGSKLIGTPNIFKFDKTYTSNSNGQILLNNIEWDTYTPELTSSSYMIYGSSPIGQPNILPDADQEFNLILGPKTQNSLLVIVKDVLTSNPVKEAQVSLHGHNYTADGFTEGSVWNQQDWSDGQSDGNVSNNNILPGLRLAEIGNNYVSFGSLESSSFDTGTKSTSYTTLSWEPASQDPATSIKFQIAANNDNLTWNFTGPDGTNQTYYTVPGTTINNIENNRYIKYKVFLSTEDSSKTPVLTSVNVGYISGCYSPGQIMFAGLSEGSGYKVTVSLNGYQTQTIDNIEIDGNNVLQVLLSQ